MRIAVVGAGSWGTALSQLLAGNGHEVALWARRASVAEGVNARHRNPDYLAEWDLSPSIRATTSVACALDGAEAVVVVTPSGQMRAIAQALKDASIADNLPIVVCTKGVEEATGMVPVEVFADVLGHPRRFAALAGPNHAEEVVAGVPAGTVIASASQSNAAFFQRAFATDAFRTYTSSDVMGVELCAAFKNVIAIAVGASYGIGYGDNTAAMLMTRGLAEMSRLVTQAGGNPLTCMGLAGAGDLMVTCMSRHSRNRRFGEMLAQGATVEDFSKKTHMVAEGAFAARSLRTLAARYAVELPITDVVRGVVWEGLDVRDVRQILTSRPLTQEIYGL